MKSKNLGGSSHWLRGVVPLLFLLSGFSGLVYQVVWVRWLALAFGVSAYAVSMVLAVYFGGLALGGWLGGKLASYKLPGLRLYGVLEIGIGVYAVWLSSVSGSLDEFYRSIYVGLGSNLGLWQAARLVLASVLLITPTTMMGATFPLIVSAYKQLQARLGAGLAGLYALNTIGGMMGVLLAGFVLIGGMGLHNTTLAAAVINIIVGLAALGFSLARAAGAAQTALGGGVSRDGSDGSPQQLRRVLLAGLFLSGVAALGYEVVWTRVLELLIGSGTVYAFALMLATVLLGIGLGSWLLSPMADQIRRPMVWLGWLEFGVSCAMLLTMLVGGWLLAFLSFSQQIWLMASLGLFAPNVLLGAVVPLGLKVYASLEDQAGRGVGELYAANLMGGVCGSLATGFVLLPVLGSQGSLMALTMVSASVGLLWLLVSPNRRGLVWGIAPTLLLVTALAARPGWLLDRVFSSRFPGQAILFNVEEVEGTVTVIENKGIKTVYLNGRHQANDTPDMLWLHRRLAHLPLVLHPDPQRMLIVGLGSGSTAGAATLYPLEQLKVIELSPAMIEAAALFTASNYNIINHPRAQIVAGDGRQFLLLTDETFDVIEADIIPPRQAYSGFLYSADFYRLARARLSPGGMMAQWMDTTLPEQDYKLLLRTFVSVFPNANLWQGGNFVIGLRHDAPLDLSRLEARLARLPLAEIHAAGGWTSVAELKQDLTLGPQEILEYVGQGPILTDNWLYLEYYLARSPIPASSTQP